MDWSVIIVITIVVVITAIHSGISAAFEMLIALLLGWGAYCVLRRIISRFLFKRKNPVSTEESTKAKLPMEEAQKVQIADYED